MIRNASLAALAVGSLLFAVIYVARAQSAPPIFSPEDPPISPFHESLAGVGVVEAQTENIAIGSALPGVVAGVFVKPGASVRAGDVLFKLDDRNVQAELKSRQANLASAEAQLHRLERMPRPEELPPSEARVREAKANLEDLQDQLSRARVLHRRNAMAEEELVRRQQGYQKAREQLARAVAEHALLQAGAWEPDKAVARAAVEQMRAQVEQTRIEANRLSVRAPVDGEILQVNVRPGEYVGTVHRQANILFGNIQRLHLRVDLDEHDVARFQTDARATALVRGSPRDVHALTFVRVEPYVSPKKSLTGENAERVDTRVLQVVYAIETRGKTVYVGQQMDVFIEVNRTPRGGGLTGCKQK